MNAIPRSDRYGRSRKLQRQQNIVSYLFLLPFLFFFLCFVVVPMGMGVVTSFFNYTMKEFTFIGLGNYKELFPTSAS